MVHSTKSASAQGGALDEAALDRLRNDPEVVWHVRAPGDDRTRFVPEIRVTEPIDVLELIGRRPVDEDTDE